VPVGTYVASARPYRASEVISEHMTGAPGIVRLVSFSGLAFAHLFALALLNWICRGLDWAESR